MPYLFKVVRTRCSIVLAELRPGTIDVWGEAVDAAVLAVGETGGLCRKCPSDRSHAGPEAWMSESISKRYQWGRYLSKISNRILTTANVLLNANAAVGPTTTVALGIANDIGRRDESREGEKGNDSAND